MFVGCLLIEHFSFAVHAIFDPRLKEKPVVLASQAQGVVDCSPQAASLGIKPGMPLRQALARSGSLLLVEPDPERYRREWERILDALQDGIPDIEDAGLGFAYVDLEGLDRLYGGDANVAVHILGSVRSGMEARLGIGHGKFSAYAAALDAAPHSAFKAPEALGQFLAPKSVDLLPVSWEVRTRLKEFGLRTLGSLAAQEIGPVQAQFGPTGRFIWELARGIDSRPLVLRQVETTVEEALTFPAPMAEIGPVLLGVKMLLQRGYGRPVLRGRFARVLLLRGEVENRRPWLRRIVFHEATGSPERALFAVKSALDGVSLPGPLESLSLTLAGITGEAGTQLNFFVEIRKRENLAEAVRQAWESTGRRVPLYRVEEVEPWSRHPERRHALVEYVP